VDDVAESSGKGHGRVERRRLRATTRLNGYLDWPGLRQVCVLERTRRVNGEESTETAFAVTSLRPSRARAGRLLELARAHWDVENRLHYVRDVSLGEDACRVRTGSAPEVLSGLRNAAIRLIRAAGLTNLAAALRRFAAHPLEAVSLVLGADADGS
jgi:predicted transposase YbfD/YdcC